MKVLSVIHHPFYGGPQNHVLRLDRALAARGWRSVVLLPAETGNAAERLRRSGVQVIQVPLPRLRARRDPCMHLRFLAGSVAGIGMIRAVVRREHIDLVQVMGLVNPHGAVAARIEGVPVVWQILDTRSPPALRLACMPVVKLCANVVMTTGTRIAGAHPGATSFGDRLVPFFPPVETGLFTPSAEARREARGRLGVPNDALLAGTVANITPQKGLEHFVQAAARVARRVPNSYFAILGGRMATHDAYADTIHRQANLTGLVRDGRFVIRDPGDTVAACLPAFDVFLMTSVPRSEGVPTTVLEAMSSGLPVIATDVGGTREVVANGETGFVVPPLDDRAIAAATLALLADPARRAAMGRRGRERAVAHFDVETCADTHVRAFNLALAHHGRPPCAG